MKSVLKYPGGKSRIADWICGYIPEHTVYLELFFGSGAIFFNKKPARIETLNDLDGNVVNFFRVIREHPEELSSLLEMTPFARDEYELAHASLDEGTDVERARKFAVRCWMSFAGGVRYKNGFRSSQCSASPHTTKAWSELPELVILAAERLKNAQIENLPALELIHRYNTPDVFIYADPPYLHSTRKNYLYQYEMSEQDHVKLLDALIGHPGKVLLSGYDNELYDRILSGWNKVQKKTQAECGLPKVETLWMNYELEPKQLELQFEK